MSATFLLCPPSQSLNDLAPGAAADRGGIEPVEGLVSRSHGESKGEFARTVRDEAGRRSGVTEGVARRARPSFFSDFFF